MSKTLVIGANPAAHHNYLQALEDLIASGALADLAPGRGYRLAVVHADGCPIFAGRRCDCEPEFELTEAR